jgi:cytosine/adenosine deaminase-related metal-dependent hydrolase
MRKISADIIFPISSSPIENGVLVINDAGKILEVLPRTGIDNFDDVEQYKGFICPGFVNTHCHLELSHLRGKLKQGTHLFGFIEELQQIRKTDADEIKLAIEKAEAEMLKNGIVAVGDISNGNNSFFQKQKQNLYYHTFIEVFGFNENESDLIFAIAADLCTSYKKEVSSNVSITPHAHYSVSKKLMQNILESNPLISIHNQESDEENKMFESGKGEIIKMLKKFGLETDKWKVPQRSSLSYFLENLKEEQKILLVHNTFTSANDIELTMQSKANVYWCFCVNANLYIENTLPNIPLFVKNNCKITIGTDSLASNYSLSVLEELRTIKKYYPEIKNETLLKWGTLNGAEFLGIEKHFGSFEKGKTPGVILIDEGFTNIQKLF